ncbi:MAG: hypothetical protein JXR77_04545 [Lentisphaeria bacterium]|nr:hypothetical protein [Lentisphaeria bacterium]
MWTISGRRWWVLGVALAAWLAAGRGLAAEGPALRWLRSQPVTVRPEGLGLDPFTVSRRGESWEAVPEDKDLTLSEVRFEETSSLDPALAELALRAVDAEATATIRLWLAVGGEKGRESVSPFFAEMRMGGDIRQSWDVRLAATGAPDLEPDRDRVSLWAYEHRQVLSDPEFVATIADHFWHHQGLDRPPGSYNRLIDMNLRIIELAPREADAYSTTAWLLWSKWVSWKTDPERMPDGEGKVEKALALLAQGEKLNGNAPDYLYQAGTVLTPLMRFHRPDLHDTVRDYLLRAATAAGDGPLAVRTRRALAAHFFLRQEYDQATLWYRRLLEVDPENEVATRRLREIEGRENAPPPAAP